MEVKGRESRLNEGLPAVEVLLDKGRVRCAVYSWRSLSDKEWRYVVTITKCYCNAQVRGTCLKSLFLHKVHDYTDASISLITKQYLAPQSDLPAVP